MVFYTSELRFDDINYSDLRHCTSVSDMNQKIIDGWNSIVTDSDTVYILGGVGNYEYLKGLNGEKRLVMCKDGIAEFQKWRALQDIKDEDLAYEVYDKYLRDMYGIAGISHHGSLIKKSCTGSLLWLTTDKNRVRDGIFTLYGNIKDFQKMTTAGINASIYVNNFYPISETEVEYYSKHLGDLV